MCLRADQNMLHRPIRWNSILMPFVLTECLGMKGVILRERLFSLSS
jgi:hypothetical protein